MDTEQGYYKRLLSRSWRETKSVWTSYRWWLSGAAPIASVVLLIIRQGWRSVMSAQDVLINASVGAGIAFAGSLVISFFRSHRLLDLDRADQVRGLLRANGALEDELKTKRAPEISRKERAQRVLVAEKLSVMADAELAVIQYMLYHGQIDRAGLINSGIASTSAIDLAIHKAIESHLLQTSGHANRFQVNQEFVSALEHHFSD